jgi:hypothetical protein
MLMVVMLPRKLCCASGKESITYYPSPQPFGFGDDPA